ncbi:MAG: amidohydrolase, partial [Bacteroidetes bacterium]|nr:amidohydrolase [Bacteroidota bacterium]
MKIFRLLLLFLLTTSPLFAQMSDSPDRSEGEGPFERLIIRGVTMIDGTGSPAIGPVDIVIRENRIDEIRNVGYPGVPIDEEDRPVAGENDKIIDASGMYILPGFIDMHAHTGGAEQGTTPEYVYKLWLAHGITSIREPGSFNGLNWTLRHKLRSEENSITAPRIFAYLGFGMGSDSEITTPEEARDWVRMIDNRGADGIKFFGARPEIFQAALDEAKKLG